MLGVVILVVSLLIGMIGYRYFEGYSWTDAYLNASMILSGMGQIADLKTESGKIFAGSYALFSGVTFLVIIAIVLAPLYHRFLKKFHLDQK